MINALTGLGYGIIGFAILVGIGIIVLGSLGTAIASCPTGYTYNSNGTATFSHNTCCMSNGTANPNCLLGQNTTPASTATQTVNTINGTYLGTNLVSWIPVIIVLVIGMLFLGAFLSKKGKKY